MIKNCIVCKKPIHRGGRGNSITRRRADRAVTCSFRCSRLYGRIASFVMNRYHSKRRKEGK